MKSSFHAYTDLVLFVFGLSLASYSQSVICTPEVLRVPLKKVQEDESNEQQIETDNCTQHTQRFVLGTDGLWDVLSTEEAGKHVSRHPVRQYTTSEKNQTSETVTTVNGDKRHQVEEEGGTECDFDDQIVLPKQAAFQLMEACLKNNGYVDDVTIVVVDISYR